MAQRRGSFLAIGLIALLLCVHGIVSYTATLTKNATIDEPTHALQAYVGRWYGDYRVETSNPPLWTRWVALGLPKNILHMNFDLPIWPRLLDWFGDAWQWNEIILYKTPGNDPDRFINHARRMMVWFSIALGATLAWWAWQSAGAVAAVVATVFFSFDPNFLGHGTIVKNDVAITFCWTAFCAAVWAAGRGINIWRLTGICFFCAAAVTTKLNGMLCLPLLALLLLIRAMMPAPWPVMRWRLEKRPSKAAAAVIICFLAALCCWGMIWASYGFQFGVSRDASQHLDMTELAKLADTGKFRNDREENPPERKSVSLVLWLDRAHLLPEPFLAGVLYLEGWNQQRPAFLMGHRRSNGWWDYFFWAALVKTPMASMVAALLAVFILILIKPDRAASRDWWLVICLAIPFLLYGILASCSAQNVGIRHVFPMAPPIFIAIGMAAARTARRWPRMTAAVGIVVVAVLAAETATAYPDYIAFFNVAAGGERAGIHLLSDSNLDWGQDLKGLVAWRREHPEGQLDLDYLGTADPDYYLGKNYVKLNDAIAQDRLWAWEPGYMAVSATHLQGLYVAPAAARFFGQLIQMPPTAVIHGTIYIYRLPLTTKGN